MKFWSNSEIPGAHSQVPEKKLLAAVLQRAITDFIGGQGELRDTARAWLMEEDCADAPLTFGFICEALDLDPLGLRRGILTQATAAQNEMFLQEAAV